MEETACFLNLTIHGKKPIVLVGAMRVYNALNAGGPVNLCNAVVAASAHESKGRGVLVAMNDVVLGGERDVIKTHTTGI
ncbi:MAG: asparaginase domain-containing protein [Flavobacteriales bacterium]